MKVPKRWRLADRLPRRDPQCAGAIPIGVGSASGEARTPHLDHLVLGNIRLLSGYVMHRQELTSELSYHGLTEPSGLEKC